MIVLLALSFSSYYMVPTYVSLGGPESSRLLLLHPSGDGFLKHSLLLSFTGPSTALRVPRTSVQLDYTGPLVWTLPFTNLADLILSLFHSTKISLTFLSSSFSSLLFLHPKLKYLSSIQSFQRLAPHCVWI